MMANKVRWMWDAARDNGIQVTSKRVKGHCGIKGNEEADKLANQGRQGRSTDQMAFISLAWVTSQAKRYSLTEWEKSWEREGTRRGKYYLATPTTRNKTTFPPADRTNKVTISRLRTRHINIRQYLKRIGKTEKATCECSKEDQSVDHILLRCEATQRARRHATTKLPQIDIHTLLYTNEGVKQTLKIWKEFERWRKKEREKEEIMAPRDRELEWGLGDL